MSKRITIAALAAALLGGLAAYAQGPTGQLTVTVEAKRGKSAEGVQSPDFRVTIAGKPAVVSEFTQVGDAPMQLLLLIDDSASFSLGTEIKTLKDFVTSLPESTQIGIGYMRNGLTDYVQQFTTDHAAAAGAIRLSFGRGGADVSPYDSLSYAIKHWTPAPDVRRREVVMISSGIEGLGGGLAPENQYVNKSISDAQKAGVIVFGIYNPSVGHAGHTLWRESYGQNLLSQLCEETGGESYITTFGPAVDFGPYLNQIQDAFRRQYLLTVSAPAVKKAELTPVKVKIPEKDADVAAPTAIYLRP